MSKFPRVGSLLYELTWRWYDLVTWFETHILGKKPMSSEDLSKEASENGHESLGDDGSGCGAGADNHQSDTEDQF